MLHILEAMVLLGSIRRPQLEWLLQRQLMSGQTRDRQPSAYVSYMLEIMLTKLFNSNLKK